MIKKLLSCLLVLALITAWLPVPAQALEDPEPEYVLVWQGSYRGVPAYSAGDDLLFSAGDLGWMSGFQVTYNGNMILFTRGAKTVRVNTDSHIISLEGSTTGIYMQSAAQEVDGVWYLSASSVLPWLNVGCTVENGALYVVPNPISLWDVAGSFSLDDYAFDLEACCDQIDVNSDFLQLGAYVKNNGVGIIWDLVPDFNGSSLGQDKRYYSLFSDMIQDVSATDQCIELWTDVFEAAGELNGFISSVMGPNSKLISDFCDEQEKGFYIASHALKYYTYCSLFQQDGANKTGVLQTLVDGSDASSSTGMVKAARQVIRDYSDFWDGIFTKVSYDGIDFLTGELSSATVLGELGYALNVTSNYAEAVDRIGAYLTISGEAKNGFAKGYGSRTLAELTDYVNYTMLYLYAAEQNYRAIAQYMENKHIGPTHAYYEFLDQADAAEHAYAMFLNISLNLDDDCMDYGLKREATAEYLELFQELDFDLTPRDAAAAAEQAIFLAALQDMGMGGLMWTVSDTDGDGQSELIAECRANGADDWPSFLCLDPNHLQLGSYTSPAFSKAAELAVGNDGQTYYLKAVDYTVPYTETIYSWSSGRWTEETYYEAIQNFDSDLGDYVTESESYYLRNSLVGAEEYQSAVDALDLSDREPVLDSPDLLDQTVPGNAKEIFDQLDTYFSKRCSNYAQFSGQDLNGDGAEDRVYAIFGAANFWLENLYATSSFGGEAYLSYTDTMVTVVTAETQADGVRLRVCRVAPPQISVTTMIQGSSFDPQEKTLTIGEDVYTYQSSGAPFVKTSSANELALTHLLGVTPDQAASLLENYFEWGEPDAGMAQGELGGAIVTLTFSEYYGAAREDSVLVEVIITPWNLYPVPIVEGVDASMSAGEIRRNMTSCTKWTDFEPMEGYDSTIFYYNTTCYYLHSSGDIYEVTASFYEDNDDASLAYMTFRLAEDVPQSVRDELNQ